MQAASESTRTESRCSRLGPYQTIQPGPMEATEADRQNSKALPHPVDGVEQNRNRMHFTSLSFCTSKSCILNPKPLNPKTLNIAVTPGRKLSDRTKKSHSFGWSVAGGRNRCKPWQNRVQGLGVWGANFYGVPESIASGCQLCQV